MKKTKRAVAKTFKNTVYYVPKLLRSTTALVSYAMLEAVLGFALLHLCLIGAVVEAKDGGLCGKLLSNGIQLYAGRDA